MDRWHVTDLVPIWGAVRHLRSRAQKTEPAVDAMLLDGMALFLWNAWFVVIVGAFFTR
jgi:hypothetical protein